MTVGLEPNPARGEVKLLLKTSYVMTVMLSLTRPYTGLSCTKQLSLALNISVCRFQDIIKDEIISDSDSDYAFHMSVRRICAVLN